MRKSLLALSKILVNQLFDISQYVSLWTQIGTRDFKQLGLSQIKEGGKDVQGARKNVLGMKENLKDRPINE